MRLPHPLASLLIAAIALAILPLSSGAYNPVTTIPIPGGLVSMDISWADGFLGRDYIADRTNNAIDVINTRNNTFAGRISAPGGPNGVTTDSAAHLAIFGDNASNVTIASADNFGIISVISTGGTQR